MITYDDSEDETKIVKVEQKENLIEHPEHPENMNEIKIDTELEVENENLKAEENNKALFSKKKISICFPDSIVALHQVFFEKELN